MKIFVGAALAAGLALLGGCTERVAGQARADKAALAIDHFGCPDLTGTYAFNTPGGEGTSYQGSILEELPVEQGNRFPGSQISGLAIRREAQGVYELRFFIDDERVMQELQLIREFEKPRYRAWYHLLRDPERAAWIARNGETSYAQRMAELGPRVEIVKQLRAGTDIACEDGWLELPRAFIKPIRLTRAEDGSVVGESREIDTVGVSVWCGDGCAELPIPTGIHTGTLRWPRNDALRAWRPEVMANRFDFERPIDEIEAEVAAREAAQVRSDAQRYAPAGTIRARIAPLVPAGTTLDEVVVRGGKVHVRYTVIAGNENGLLGSVAGAGGDADEPGDVVRRVFSGRPGVTEVEFTLTDSPLVAPEPVVDAAVPAAVLSDSMAVLSRAPPTAPTQPAPGIADAATIRRRVRELFPAGSRITDVRYGNGTVTVVGEADSNRSVSEGLRAIDGARRGQDAPPDLVQIEMTPARRVRFEILLRRSALIAE